MSKIDPDSHGAAFLNPIRPANQRRAAVLKSDDATSTLIGRSPDYWKACEMGDSDWMSALALPACQAQSVEGNQLRKRPALMSKLFPAAQSKLLATLAQTYDLV